jgi:hypothetical protein
VSHVLLDLLFPLLGPLFARLRPKHIVQKVVKPERGRRDVANAVKALVELGVGELPSGMCCLQLVVKQPGDGVHLVYREPGECARGKFIGPGMTR